MHLRRLNAERNAGLTAAVSDRALMSLEPNMENFSCNVQEWKTNPKHTPNP